MVEALVAASTDGRVAARRPDAARARRAREMAEGKNNAAIAAVAVPHRALGREGDPFDLPQARPRLGDGGPQAGEGGAALPRGARLALPQLCEHLPAEVGLVEVGRGAAAVPSAGRSCLPIGRDEDRDRRWPAAAVI